MQANELLGLNIAMAKILAGLTDDASRQFFQDAVGTIINFKKLSEVEFQELNILSQMQYINDYSYFYASSKIALKVAESEIKEAKAMGLTVFGGWITLGGLLSSEALHLILGYQLKYQKVLKKFDSDIERGIDFSLEKYRQELQMYISDFKSFKKCTDIGSFRNNKEEIFIEYTQRYLRFILGMLLLFYVAKAGIECFENDTVIKNLDLSKYGL